MSNAEKVESQYMKFHRKYAFILSPSDGFAAGAADVLAGGLMVAKGKWVNGVAVSVVAVCGTGPAKSRCDLIPSQRVPPPPSIKKTFV